MAGKAKQMETFLKALSENREAEQYEEAVSNELELEKARFATKIMGLIYDECRRRFE